jgi:hypothetical protein
MILAIIIIILICALCFSKYENILPGRCPRKLPSGIRYRNMEVCKKKCPHFIPEHLKHKNYCKRVHDDAVGCFPPDWKFN